MFALAIYRFFRSRRILLAVIVSMLVICFVFFAQKLRLEEDISQFLPKDPASQKLNRALKQLKIQDRLIINIYGNDSTAAEEMIRAADHFADTLLKMVPAEIREFTRQISDERMTGVYDLFSEYLPVFLDQEGLAQIGRKLNEDSVQQALENNYKTLLSPSGVILGKYLLKDPLSFTGMALRKVNELQLDTNFRINQGYIFSGNHRNLLMFVTPRAASADYTHSKILLGAVEKAQALTLEKFPSLHLEYFGAAAVAAGNSDQIRKDTTITSLIALSLICLLLFFYFRRLLVIVYILLPVVFGALFALALLYFLKGEMSAIAIGAGSIILGIAINYSLHFFTHYRHEPSEEKVISDLTLPMLIGCTTTIGAFLSLQFTKSAALHDFGLFAGLSLIGAVLFSIIVLPHLLRPGKKSKNIPQSDPAWLNRFLSSRPDKNRIIVWAAFLLTFVFAFFAGSVRFESDMMTVNYQDEKLQQAQEHLESINRNSLSSQYLVSHGSDREQAMRRNERAMLKLRALQRQGVIQRISSPSLVLVSDSLQKLRIAQWNAFWTTDRKDSLQRMIRYHGGKLGFSEDAFNGFLNSLNRRYEPLPAVLLDSLQQMLVKDLVNDDQGLVNVLRVSNSEKKLVARAFENDEGVVVFDRQTITSRFVEAISSDFSLILMITGLLVFGFMLLSHGRIELAIINFLPMFISWLWILGIMALLGLKFNVINIIISTFIFGLGDDYSIFILDGLSHEYKFGRKNLDSYKGSILLSALTNIIGIGVLIFAKHPALRSIAAITIVGMLTVLFISFVVQPLAYDFLILKRKKRGLLPYTAFNLLITFVGFVFFTAGSLFLTVFGFVLFFLVPVPRAGKKYLFHWVMMMICRFMIYLFFNVKKKIINPGLENFSRPAVIVANHQSHIDLAMILMLHPRIIVFTNDWVWNSPFYGWIVKMADFYPASRGYENAMEQVKALTGLGYSVLIFPEGTRSASGDILRFHKGAFYLAQQLQLDVLPLLMHGTGDVLTKNDFHFKEGRLSLQFLPRVAPAPINSGGYKEQAKAVCNLMRQKYAELKEQQETVDYFRPRLVRNYIYKGPVLEWYCRVKVALEDNYRAFECELPKSGQITDVGCGYGFLGLMLAMKGPDRKILGVDYDEEKIGIAANCISVNSNTRFEQGDVTRYDFPVSDGFVISDVLHYLLPQQQVELIERCVQKLNPGGVMIIRDADADKKKRHLGTRYTEFFSTNSGFNKTAQGGLHFTSAELIRNTLGRFPHLSYHVVDDTRLTSNITFIVKAK